MSTIRYMLALVALAVTLPVSTAAEEAPRPGLRSLQLEWRPAIELGDLGPVDLGGIAALTVEVRPLADARGADRALGRAPAPGGRGTVAVTTSGDVAKFVTDQATRLLREMGMSVVPRGGAVLLAGEVRRFFVVEEDLYEAEVELELSLATRQGGELWRGRVDGSASRYGVPAQAEVYQEVLSDALYQAIHRLVTDPEARQALRELAAR
jgi:hypothetical protein